MTEQGEMIQALFGLGGIALRTMEVYTSGTLDAWLGFEGALGQAFDRGEGERLREVYREWPHFRSVVDLIEMVLAKADGHIAAQYDRQLVPPELQSLGDDLRERLERARTRRCSSPSTASRPACATQDESTTPPQWPQEHEECGHEGTKSTKKRLQKEAKD